MRPSTAVMTLVTLAAGVGGGWTAYGLAAVAGEPPETTTPTAVTKEAPEPVARGTRLRWAPCQPPAELRGDACVTSVVRTVTLPAPAAAPAPAPVPVPVPQAAASRVVPASAASQRDEGGSRHDDEADGRGEDGDDDHDDHGDDDHGDEDHGDEDHAEGGDD